MNFALLKTYMDWMNKILYGFSLGSHEQQWEIDSSIDNCLPEIVLKVILPHITAFGIALKVYVVFFLFLNAEIVQVGELMYSYGWYKSTGMYLWWEIGTKEVSI